MTDLIERHLKKLRARDTISAEEERVVRGLISHTITVPADRTFVRAGQELKESTLLLDGWMARVKDLPTGERQIAELHVAGDFMDLHGFTLKHLDHDVVSISPSIVGVAPHERVREMTEKYPHLTRIYWFSTNLDAAIQREWTLSLGRRAALSRMAHLFCELYVRLEIAGLAANNRYAFPLTQVELAECLGLTPVHVNRTLQELRRVNLIEVRDWHVEILDMQGLIGVAQFDPAYLYVEKREQ
jgi:CRP-like cAMP-binding protein